mmetsp:Transcript_153553/g.271010  ORF Transcript_153553/g.271010 Transcript_153553/m.271010 type:complete len:303 (+) Transcript_153553:66-974(+)
MASKTQNTATPVVMGHVVTPQPHGKEQRSPFQSSHLDVEAPAAGDYDAILQMSCQDANLPAEIRLGFVIKVYALVCVMLLITFGLASPFVFATEKTLEWMSANRWLLTTVVVVLLLQYVFNLVMMLQMFCGESSLFQCYMKMFKTVPWNFVYLFVFAACFGAVVGFPCANYTVESVLLVFGISIVLVLALTAYAVKTKADFTGMGPYVLVGLVGLILVGCVGFFFPVGSLVPRLIGAAGAMFFGFIIVYDTQLIFGSASFQFGGGKRGKEYTIDMYAFAAFNLYLDFINFFQYLLQAFGERK